MTGVVATIGYPHPTQRVWVKQAVPRHVQGFQSMPPWQTRGRVPPHGQGKSVRCPSPATGHQTRVVETPYYLAGEARVPTIQGVEAAPIPMVPGQKGAGHAES